MRGFQFRSSLKSDSCLRPSAEHMSACEASGLTREKTSRTQGNIQYKHTHILHYSSVRREDLAKKLIENTKENSFLQIHVQKLR